MESTFVVELEKLSRFLSAFQLVRGKHHLMLVRSYTLPSVAGQCKPFTRAEVQLCLASGTTIPLAQVSRALVEEAYDSELLGDTGGVD